MALRDLGLSAEQERIYRALVSAPGLSPHDLCELLGLPLVEVEASIVALADLDVVRLHGVALEVRRPSVAIGDVIERREEDLMHAYRAVSAARADLPELDAAFQKVVAAPSSSAIEHMEDLTKIRARLEELSFYASRSVFSIQPGGPQSAASLDASRPLDRRLLRRRVDLRLIHETTVLADEGNREYLRDLAARGASVRLTDQHIERMIIIDDQCAVVAVDPSNSSRGALIVRQPGLIAGFLDLFHRVWTVSQALPDTGGSGAEGAVEASEADLRLLRLLASGTTDEVAAREIGISVRHLRRHISRLMAELGAGSRFEAGVEAARRGWL